MLKDETIQWVKRRRRTRRRRRRRSSTKGIFNDERSCLMRFGPAGLSVVSSSGARSREISQI
jgi:hypothetical protein